MNIEQAIEYLQPIADNAQLAGYQTALNVALDAMREVKHLREELKNERYRHDRQADFTVGQGQEIDRLTEELRAYRETGLSPVVCAEYKKFEDEAISKGVTFNSIVELMEAERAGRLVVLEEVKNHA